MAAIAWSREFEIGVPEVDAQHRHLVEIVNKFEDARAKGKATRVLGEIIRELIGYTQEHFAFEEAYMLRVEYPRLKLHQAKHRQLIAKVERFQFEFNQGRRISIEIHDFLKYWLLNHILEDDKAIATAGEPAATPA